MPTLGAHFSDEIADTIRKAAAVSPEKNVSPYIGEAVLQRLNRDGMLPGNPRAEVNAAIDELGVDEALEVLKKASRRKGAQVRTVNATAA